MKLTYVDNYMHVETGTPKAIYQDEYLKNYKVDLSMLDIPKPRLEFWAEYKTEVGLGVEFLSVVAPKDEKDKDNIKKYSTNYNSVLFRNIANVDCDYNGHTYIGVITTKSGIRYVIDEATSNYIMTNLYYWEKSNFK